MMHACHLVVIEINGSNGDVRCSTATERCGSFYSCKLISWRWSKTRLPRTSIYNISASL